MGTLREQIEADVANVFLNADDFAETVTYTPSGGSPKDILAIVADQGASIEDDSGRAEIRSLSISISTDATLGIASPSEKDAVTIDAVVYEVERVGARDRLGMVEVFLVRIDQIERARDEYRRRS